MRYIEKLIQVVLKYESFIGQSCSASTQEDEDKIILSLKGTKYSPLWLILLWGYDQQNIFLIFYINKYLLNQDWETLAIS